MSGNVTPLWRIYQGVAPKEVHTIFEPHLPAVFATWQSTVGDDLVRRVLEGETTLDTELRPLIEANRRTTVKGGTPPGFERVAERTAKAFANIMSLDGSIIFDAGKTLTETVSPTPTFGHFLKRDWGMCAIDVVAGMAIGMRIMGIFGFMPFAVPSITVWVLSGLLLGYYQTRRRYAREERTLRRRREFGAEMRKRARALDQVLLKMRESHP